ncbi:MAG: hypothetical protein HN337_04875 [Deltaproteobacteria bacterium]|jgi:tetratricopeptide (TPR) repeat protein|nr:hypothetical protein [Deltaproteobacteria bacterium]
MLKITNNIITLSLIAAFLLIPTASSAQDGGMLGASPATPPKKPSKAAPKSETKKKPPPLTATTKSDYSQYWKVGHKSGKWNQFIKPGFETFDNGNMATSAIFLQKAYDKGCRDPLVLFRLAIIKESRKEYDEAAKLIMDADRGLEERYSSHPITKAIHKHAARALFTANKNSEALPHLTEALKYEPDDFMLLFMAGQVLHQMGEAGKALVPLEKALTVTPPEGNALDAARSLLHELIIVTYEVGNADACAGYVDKMLTLDPADPLANKYKNKVGFLRRKNRESEMLKKLVQ